ncbi:MAG: M48 family metalloprotease [Bdellovibrio sp.]
MRFLLCLLPIVTALALSVGQAQPRLVDENTRQALKRIGRDSAHESRSLLTPAYGAMPQEIKDLREEITRILKELGGAELNAYDKHWVVNIYADSQPNAWVRQLFHPERTWNTKPKPTVSYRQAMNFADDGKPVYEFGFSAGLFNVLQTRDQLAFVIGHELTHLLENHISSESGFVEGQQHEVVADAGSIRRLVGKYNLKAGAEVMDLLYKSGSVSERPGSLIDMLMSGLASHHHEGQRISALQFAAEHHLRADERAQIMHSSTPLPERYRLHSKQNRPQTDTSYEQIWGGYYRELLSKAFLQNQPEAALMEEGRGIEHSSRPSTISSETREQRTSLILKMIQEIEVSSNSKSVKLNALLQTFIVMSAGFTDKFSFKDFTIFERHQVVRFLARQSAGADGWKYSDYARLEDDMKPQSRLAINAVFLGSDGGRTVLAQLVKTFPEWRRLFESLHNPQRFSSAEGKINTDLLQKEILRIERSNSTELMNEYRRQFSRMVKGLQWPDGKMAHFEYLEDVRKAMSNRPLKTEEIFKTLKVGEPVVRGDLDKIRSQVLEDSKRSDFEFKTKYRLSNETLEVAAKSLNDPSLSAADRKSVFSFIGFFIQDVRISTDSEVSKNIIRYMQSLPREERLSLLTDYPPLLKQQRDKTLALIKRLSLASDDIYEAFEKMEPNDFDHLLTLVRIWAAFKTNTLRLFHSGNQMAFIESLSPMEVQEVFSALESHQRDLFIMDSVNFSNKTTLSINTQMLQKHRDASAVLSKMLLQNLSSMAFSDFQKRWVLMREVTGELVAIPRADHDKISIYLQDKLKDLSQPQRYALVLDRHLNSFLSTQDISQVILNQVQERLPQKASLGQLAAVVTEIVREGNLQTKTDLYNHLRNAITEKWNLQPTTVHQVFPLDERTATQKTAEAQNHIRGLSSLLASSRGQSVSAQMQMIDYLMGRVDRWPAYIDQIEADLQKSNAAEKNGISLVSALMSTREEMQLRPELERAALVNSFLTGPTGLIKDAKSLAVVSDRIISAVSPENRDLAQIMLEALYQAEGANKSIFLSYVLAQKSSTGALSEALVLKSILDAYGVPGVKLAQYLSFTDEFRSFKSTLETYQDSAMPISYYDMLLLIQERLGKKWNSEKHRIVKILGTGSVNIAVEYVDLETGKSGVLNISRKDITTKTSEDFYRMDLLLRALAQNPQHGRKFDFVAGLLGIIKNSVSLEFNKKHAFEVQKEVQTLYNRDVKGWKVRTVEAYSQEGLSILMQKAPGVGARHLQNFDPQTYRSAMAALLSVEDGILRGLGANSSPLPIPLHANPDIHDGQVLIDTKSKIVTLLDFGQAERISNLDRTLGIELLRFVSGIESASAAQKIFQARFEEMKITGHQEISESFLSEVLERTDRMDRFVRLASGLNKRGYQIPLSSIHWVLAVNRAIKLGQKIGVPMEAAYRNLLLTTKVGLSLQTYNRAASLVRPLPAAQKMPAPLCRHLLLF